MDDYEDSNGSWQDNSYSRAPSQDAYVAKVERLKRWDSLACMAHSYMIQKERDWNEDFSNKSHSERAWDDIVEGKGFLGEALTMMLDEKVKSTKNSASTNTSEPKQQQQTPVNNLMNFGVPLRHEAPPIPISKTTPTKKTSGRKLVSEEDFKIYEKPPKTKTPDSAPTKQEAKSQTAEKKKHKHPNRTKR